MNADEAADYLGVSKQRLANLRCNGSGPEYTRKGNWIQYTKEALEHWAERTGHSIPKSMHMTREEMHKFLVQHKWVPHKTIGRAEMYLQLQCRWIERIDHAVRRQRAWNNKETFLIRCEACFAWFEEKQVVTLCKFCNRGKAIQKSRFDPARKAGVSVRVDKALYEQLKPIAAKRAMFMQDLLDEVITFYLEHHLETTDSRGGSHRLPEEVPLDSPGVSETQKLAEPTHKPSFQPDGCLQLADTTE